MENSLEIIDNVGFHLGYVSNELRNALTKSFSESGFNIHASQFPILAMLWFKDGVTQNELTKHTYKDKTTMTRMISILEKEELIIRKENPDDRRNKLIFLTQYGSELKEKLLPITRQVHRVAMRNIDSKEYEVLKSTLAKIYSNLKLIND